LNEIQIVYDWLINHFSSSDLVNTVSILTSEMDQNKENIYPLVNIDFYKETDEQAIMASFKITIIQQRHAAN
jgi:hypothetical protein